jgi:hypothetical protein
VICAAGLDGHHGMLDCIVVDVASGTAPELAVSIVGSALAHAVADTAVADTAVADAAVADAAVADTVLADTLVDWEAGLVGIDVGKAVGTFDLEVGLAGTAVDTFGLEAGLAGTAVDKFGLEVGLAAGVVAHTAPDMARYLCCSSYLLDGGGGDEGSSWVAGGGTWRNELRRTGE